MIDPLDQPSNRRVPVGALTLLRLCRIAVLFLLCAPATGYAQLWQEPSAPFPGRITSLHAADDGRVYVVVADEGLYVSDAPGGAWQRLFGFGTWAVTTNGDEILLAAEKLFRSTDAGATWQAILPSRVNAVVARGDTILAGGPYGQLYFSGDHGSTWDTVNLRAMPAGFDDPIENIVLTTSGSVLYHVRGDHILLHFWDGKGLYVLPSGSPKSLVLALADGSVLSARANSLLRSIDSGQSFEPYIEMPISEISGGAARRDLIAVSSDSGQTLVSAVGGRTFVDWSEGAYPPVAALLAITPDGHLIRAAGGVVQWSKSAIAANSESN